ncbi:MAG: OsmC family protein, partial [Chloroflexota bacterium]
MEAKVKWAKKGLEFDGNASNDVQVHLASGMDIGQAGFRPMELLGVGLAGCTAMDVLSILMKKKQEVVDFEVFVHTRNADPHPQVWEWVQIEYVVTGRNIDPQAVERAMELSSQKYCPAQNMINKAVNIDLVYRIVEVE